MLVTNTLKGRWLSRISVAILLVACTGQDDRVAKVNLVVVDPNGRMLEFKLQDVSSVQKGKVPHHNSFALVHSIVGKVGEIVDVEFIVRHFERSPKRQQGNRITADGTVFVLGASISIADVWGDQEHMPRKVSLSAEFCHPDTFQWVEVRMVGRSDPLHNGHIESCRANIGELEYGFYSAMLYENGMPIAAAKLAVSPNGPEIQELQFSRIGPFPRSP
jgi:hypothetical protein